MGGEQFGNLYSDERVEPALNQPALKKFEAYQKKLAKLSRMIQEYDNNTAQESSRWQVWENGLRQFYKELIYDAFDALGVRVPNDMEVHFSGSLAKAQATEYSDLDTFVLVKNKKDMAKVKPVFEALNHLCQRIFTENRQLFPDPLGINPSRLLGTPEDLYHRLKNDEVSDVEVTVNAILASKPVFGPFELGEALRDKIKQDPALNHFISAEKFYTKAILDFPAPKATAIEINIKHHIMRPLDFILMGLREEFNLYSEDGSHLSAPGTLRLLRKGKLLDETEISRIETVYNQAMESRFNLHSAHREEQDFMPYANAKEMLDDMEQIRVLAANRLSRIDNLKTAINNDVLEDVLSAKQKNYLSEYLSYAHATESRGRKHMYEVSTAEFSSLKGKYNDAKGDALKTKILAHFKTKLDEATNERSLRDIVDTLKGSDEYKVLATPQAVTTRVLGFWGVKTSSISAFEKMVLDATQDISAKQKHKFEK